MWDIILSCIEQKIKNKKYIGKYDIYCKTKDFLEGKLVYL